MDLNQISSNTFAWVWTSVFDDCQYCASCPCFLLPAQTHKGWKVRSQFSFVWFQFILLTRRYLNTFCNLTDWHLTGLTQYSYWCLYSNFSSARLSAAYWEAFVCSVFVYKKCFVWVSETYFWEAVSAYSLHFTGTSKHLFNLSSSKDSLLVLNILCYDHPIYSAVSNIEDAYLPNTLLPWGKLFFSPSGCWVKSKSLSPTSGMTQLSTGRMDCCLFMLIINQLVLPCVDLISILNLKKKKTMLVLLPSDMVELTI